MIKTATQSVTQDSAKEAEYGSESSGNVKQTAAQSKTSAAESKGRASAQARQSSADAGESVSAESIHEELQEINQKLKAWQDRVNELLNDPNNADKIVNLLNSIQYMVNRKAELNILLRQHTPSSNEYDFQDNQSILHAASVRRKDTEALRIVDRSRK